MTLPHLDLVLAVDDAWGIGRDNALPWPKLSADLQHFKRVTSEAPPGKRNAVLMGRHTWESREVGGRALPRRHNVVLSRGDFAAPAGVRAARSLDDALAQVAALDDLGQVFVIGGAQIYRLALAHPRRRAVYLTRVSGTYGCDTFVPVLDPLCVADPSWPAARHQEHGVSYVIERLMLRPLPRT
ncbi:MAG: dihydrofolate reductase [Kofleriaceae bacterium]